MAGIVGGVCIASNVLLLYVTVLHLFVFISVIYKQNESQKQDSRIFFIVVVKYPWNKTQFDTIVYGFYASCGVCGSYGGDKGNIQEGHI